MDNVSRTITSIYFAEHYEMNQYQFCIINHQFLISDTSDVL